MLFLVEDSCGVRPDDEKKEQLEWSARATV